MADEDHGPFRYVCDNLKDIGCVPVQATVPVAVIRAQVRLAAANEVEQHNPEAVTESGDEAPPHVLVTAKAVCEHQGSSALTNDIHVIALMDIHLGLRTRTGIARVSDKRA